MELSRELAIIMIMCKSWPSRALYAGNRMNLEKKAAHTVHVSFIILVHFQGNFCSFLTKQSGPNGPVSRVFIQPEHAVDKSTSLGPNSQLLILVPALGLKNVRIG